MSKVDESIKILKYIEQLTFRFMVQREGEDSELDTHVLKPKTYTEAVKALLDINQRLMEIKFNERNTTWEKLVKALTTGKEDAQG